MNAEEQHTFRFKTLHQEDFAVLLPWFQESHVAQWWPTPEPQELLEKFLQRIRSKDTFGYIVFIDEKPIGYVQYYYLVRGNNWRQSVSVFTLRQVDPDDLSTIALATVEALAKTGAYIPVALPQTTVGTDQFIGDPAYVGKGYGTRMVKAFIEFLQQIEPEVTTVIVDPEPTNYAAIRCYEKVGFKKVMEYATSYGPALLMKYDIRNHNVHS